MNSTIRWRPTLIILALNILATTWLWFFFDTMRANKVFFTFMIETLTVLLLAIWLLFFSRLVMKTRLLIFGGVIVVFVVFRGLFRMDELSGDLVPVLEWRWNEQETTLETSGGALVGDATLVSGHESIYAKLSYPQFLGPDRIPVVTGLTLERDWSVYAPRQIWKQNIGKGWSAFAIQANRAVTQEQRGKHELVVCYNLVSGDMLWHHADKARYETALARVGPRATPTISQNRVYTLGATGILNCLDLNTGNLVWQKNIAEDNNAEMPRWGYSGSPLILDSLVVVCAGGAENKSLVAYHKDSGHRIWSGGKDVAGYSSPMITLLAGERQILIFTHANVVAHNPANGAVLWQLPWTGGGEKVAQPLVLPGERVFISSGYGVGSKLIKVARSEGGEFMTEQLWKSRGLKAKFTNVVHREGFIYGLDDGILVCLDLADGKRRWKRGRYGHGQLLLVDDLLLILTEKGQLALVEANPNEFKEVARIPAIEGTTWNNPALAGHYLLVRNSKEAACFELPVSN